MIPIIAAGLRLGASGLGYLLKNPKTLMYIGFGVAVGFIYLQLQFAQGKIGRLELENANLKTQMFVLEIDKKTQENNAIIMTQRIARSEAMLKELDSSIAEIDSAPATDDGPVAPVLKRAIEGTKK